MMRTLDRPDFDTAVETAAGEPLAAMDLTILQVNLGLRCNLACRHCHVVSGPNRTEEMPLEVMEQILELAARIEPQLVDLTGGAPEIHPRFRNFVDELVAASHPVQVRTNLTIMLEEGYTDLPDYLADRRVALVASLPCYLEENVDRQRGEGVWRGSVEVLRRLNAVGYGREPELPLYLVYNPQGPSLPPPQKQLEADYRERLEAAFGITFTALYTITNLPLGRFRADLKRAGRFDAYLDELAAAFNPATLEGLMCRHQIEVAWDGTLYDCDFHLAHRLPIDEELPRTLTELLARGESGIAALRRRRIVTRDYCFGCTAGAGSSCGGALVEEV